MDDSADVNPNDDSVGRDAVEFEKVVAATYDIWRKCDNILHPPFRGRERFFSTLSLGAIAAIFGVPLAFSSPLLSAWLGCHAAASFGHDVSREIVIQMCDWFAIVLQLLIFLMIGGIAFTDSFAKKTEETLKKWRDGLIVAQYQKDEKRVAQRWQQIVELQNMLKEPGSYMAKAERIITTLREHIDEGQEIPGRYMWFAAKGIVFNFPGGLYGLLGFLSLVLQVYVLSAKIVLDHLPAACQWG